MTWLYNCDLNNCDATNDLVFFLNTKWEELTFSSIVSWKLAFNMQYTVITTISNTDPGYSL